MASPQRRQSIKEKGTDTGTGGAVFIARPSVVHFGGYKLRERLLQVVHLINVTTRGQRLHIAAPTTPHFRVTFNKKGYVAPGMHEEVTVEFLPSEWKYYSDGFEVSTEGQSFTVPLHGYPVMNDVAFPRAIDFGSVPLKEIRRKIVSLRCKVPIEFEFEILMKGQGDEIRVTPDHGSIPPHGVVEVIVEYQPTTLTTRATELELHISQYGFTPRVCRIVGCGIINTREASDTRRIRVNTLQQTQRDILHMTQHPDQAAPPVELRHAPAPPSTEPPVVEEVDGIFLPRTDVRSHAAVASILMQQPGKMRIGDLKAKLAAQAKGEKSTPEEEEKEADWHVQGPRQMRQMAFERALRKYQEFERSKEIRWFRCIGEVPTAESDIKNILASRRRELATRARAKRTVDRERTETQLIGERVIHDMGRATDPPPAVWDVGESGSLLARKAALKRFLRAVHTVIIRYRARCRLVMLKAACTKQRMIGSALPTDRRENSLPDFRFRNMGFPTAKVDLAPEFSSVDVPPFDLFEELEPHPEKPLPQHILSGYQACPLGVTGGLPSVERPSPSTGKNAHQGDADSDPTEVQQLKVKEMQLAAISPTISNGLVVTDPLAMASDSGEIRLYTRSLPFSEADILFALRPRKRDVAPPTDRATMEHLYALTTSVDMVTTYEKLPARPLGLGLMDAFEPPLLTGPISGDPVEEDEDDEDEDEEEEEEEEGKEGKGKDGGGGGEVPWKPGFPTEEAIRRLMNVPL